MQAYDALMGHMKQISALQGVAGLLSWDQEAMMPRTGAEQRAEQAGALSAVTHGLRTDPRIGDWLASVDAGSLDAAGQANLREVRRAFERATKIPADLAEENAKTTARAQGQWADARAAEDVAAFLPVLARVVDLARQQAECLAEGSGGDALYDALMDDYEPGATAAGTAALFGRLRTGLATLRAQIADAGGASDGAVPRLSGDFPRSGQLALAERLAHAFGYDAEAGRIDLVVHPFCSGTRGDVRITTRVDEGNPFDCLYSTIHETGHALYEQGLPQDLAWQPAGGSVSMGVHESQSRICENQIARSEPFCTWLFPKMIDTFGPIGVETARDFYRAVNRVVRGYIRTEADEVHYNLHIMMRFELERALISGDLTVNDLEAAWNDRFLADFGVAVDKPSNGMLQDVHWSVGLIGYFPTYALGNVYAGALNAAMRRDLPDMDAAVAAGDVSAPVAWLRRHVHGAASLHSPAEIVAKACGVPADETALLAYLQAKYGNLYGL
ncbi:MAG: carboxypeptidase M32 [Pseudomonadota bacterium]